MAQYVLFHFLFTPSDSPPPATVHTNKILWNTPFPLVNREIMENIYFCKWRKSFLYSGCNGTTLKFRDLFRKANQPAMVHAFIYAYSQLRYTKHITRKCWIAISLLCHPFHASSYSLRYYRSDTLKMRIQLDIPFLRSKQRKKQWHTILCFSLIPIHTTLTPSTSNCDSFLNTILTAGLSHSDNYLNQLFQ